MSTIRGRLITFHTIMEEPLQPIDWLVEKLIPAGNRGVIFGEYGSFKSWFLLDLAIHVAAGRALFGQFSVPQSRKVVFIDEEMSERTLRRRVKLLAEGAGLHTEDLPFRAVSHAGIRFDGEQVRQLLQELQEEGFDPDVIVVETLRRVIEGSENDAEDVSKFWHNVLPIFGAGKTLLVSHHMRKPGTMGPGDSRHRASGSTDILAGGDCSYAITKAGALFTVECTKMRDAEEGPPFSFTLYEPQGEDGPKTLQFAGFRDTATPVETETQRVLAGCGKTQVA